MLDMFNVMYSYTSYLHVPVWHTHMVHIHVLVYLYSALRISIPCTTHVPTVHYACCYRALRIFLPCITHVPTVHYEGAMAKKQKLGTNYINKLLCNAIIMTGISV